jgi:hypothetical protein
MRGSGVALVAPRTTEGDIMKSFVASRTQALSISSMLPMLLAGNTFALLALERLGGIPTWIKSAVALFLSF